MHTQNIPGGFTILIAKIKMLKNKMEDNNFKENHWGNFQSLCIAIVQGLFDVFVGMIEWK